MEARIDAWLKTYLNETLISPVDWEELPEECRIQLDNFARDEAVNLADSFAHEGTLDLRRQDAVRQLVDALAQSWKLPGVKVRRIVEDFLDAIPPKPGQEFDKLAVRLFRRTASWTWKQIVETLNPSDETQVVRFALKHANLPAQTTLDKGSFLKALKHTYDAFTLAHPKEAVTEALEALELSDVDSIDIHPLLTIVSQRGATTWTRALELELEVDVTQSTRDDLVRILKRYALIVKREGGLQTPVEEAQPEVTKVFEPESDGEMETPGQDPELGSGEESGVQDESHLEPSIEEVPVEDEEPAFSEDDSREEDFASEAPEGAAETETEALAETEQPDEPYEEAESVVIETIEDVDADDAPPLSAEDDDALKSMFGEETEESADAPDDFSAEPPVQSVDSAAEDEHSDEKVQEERAVAVTPESDVEAEDQPEAIAETADEEVPVQEPTPVLSVAEEHETRLQDVFVPSPQGDKRDRFHLLRSGDLRKRVVNEMYEGDPTMLDVFLAKLSGAPDWNRAKQFIANEFFRCKLDLHSDLGEEFFLTLKESLRD